MRLLLAIDTSTPACSVAVKNGDEVVDQLITSQSRHTEVLLPMINDCLAKIDCKANEIDGIIISGGPGAFTGLRVGAAVAGGLALAANCQLGLISSLALLAVPYLHHHQRVLALMDARMQQCYVNLFQKIETGIEAIDEDKLINPKDLSKEMLQDVDLIVGSGLIYQNDFPIEIDKNKCQDTLPIAKNAFKCLELVRWQNPYEPIDIQYIRNEVTG